MIKETEIDTDPGRREPAEDRKRLLFGVLLLLLLTVVELTLGRQAAEQDLERFSSHWARLAIDSFDAVPGDSALPKKRILYISNSHAGTGGRVARHLQDLLDELQPERYEVVDMAAPGIFAPDMLQRLLLGLTYNPDLVIMGVAYISFSDRMKLALQSHSARSFFKPGVFNQLSGEFWLRNYDIGLYLETFLQQHLNIIRYRNDLRDLWEQPVATALKANVDKKPILFLEVDQNQGWKFPEGFDRNLFNWRLYTAGRQGHLADLAEAVRTATGHGVPVLGLNLPIHWDKSVFPHDARDYRRYRNEVADLFSGVLDFVDYQEQFPVEFTAYDALHPTWHGARLHALDMVLRMHHQGIVDDTRTPAEIAEVFAATDIAVSDHYRESLDGNYKVLSKAWFRRYDIFEPDNARMLMRYLASLPVGSRQESDHLRQLGLRLRYWQETDFALPEVDPDTAHADVFNRAAKLEIERARKRAGYFQQQLVGLQSSRLGQAPLPNLDTAVRVSVNEVPANLGMPLYLTQYRLEEDKDAVSIGFLNGRTVARGVSENNYRSGYLRVDVLGDRSFLMIQHINDPLIVPSWALHIKPFVKFGI